MHSEFVFKIAEAVVEESARRERRGLDHVFSALHGKFFVEGVCFCDLVSELLVVALHLDDVLHVWLELLAQHSSNLFSYFLACVLVQMTDFSCLALFEGRFSFRCVFLICFLICNVGL